MQISWKRWELAQKCAKRLLLIFIFVIERRHCESCTPWPWPTFQGEIFQMLLADWVEVNYPLMIAKLFVKKILVNFCIIQTIICLLFSNSSKCISLKQWSPRWSSLAVDQKRYFLIWFRLAHAAEQLLTSSVAKQECYIMYKHVDLEMLINGKMEYKLQRVRESRLIPLPKSSFKVL